MTTPENFRQSKHTIPDDILDDLCRYKTINLVFHICYFTRMSVISIISFACDKPKFTRLLRSCEFPRLRNVDFLSRSFPTSVHFRYSNLPKAVAIDSSNFSNIAKPCRKFMLIQVISYSYSRFQLK